MNQNKKNLAFLLVAILILGAVYFSAQKPRDRAVDNKIRLGFIGPLTGESSELGIGARSAVEIAIESINREGIIPGKQIEVIYEDGKCNLEAAQNAAKKLVDIDKVSAIIGGLCSEETLAFGAFAMKEKITTISYCSSAPALSHLGKYFFRTYPSTANADIAKQISKLKLKPETLGPLDLEPTAKL